MMKKTDVWKLIQQGDFDEACKSADAEYNETKNIFPLRNKVYALFHLARYQEAKTAIEKIIETENGQTDSDFIFLGIAYWFLGQNEKGIETWQNATNCKYTDAAGGIEVQTVLYFAAIKTDNIELREKVLNKIRKLTKANKSDNWPGPLGKFLIEEISEAELFSLTTHVSILRERQLCQASFAAAVKELEKGNRDEYVEQLKKSVCYGPPAYLEQLFYLAKGELDSIP